MEYFEDIAVGDRAAFGAYPVDRAEVIAFAEKFDPQPFHLSDEAAAKTPFKRLAASGWHTCAMTMAMVVAHGEERKQALLGSPGLDGLRWLKPVYPGDTLRCETEVIETRLSASKPGIGFTKSRTTVFNQDDVAVMDFIANMMVRARPA